MKLNGLEKEKIIRLCINEGVKDFSDVVRTVQNEIIHDRKLFWREIEEKARQVIKRKHNPKTRLLSKAQDWNMMQDSKSRQYKDPEQDRHL